MEEEKLVPFFFCPKWKKFLHPHLLFYSSWSFLNGLQVVHVTGIKVWVSWNMWERFRIWAVDVMASHSSGTGERGLSQIMEMNAHHAHHENESNSPGSGTAAYHPRLVAEAFLPHHGGRVSHKFQHSIPRSTRSSWFKGCKRRPFYYGGEKQEEWNPPQLLFIIISIHSTLSIIRTISHFPAREREKRNETNARADLA